MGSYTAETAPVIKDSDGNMLSFRELRICLDCGKSCDLQVHRCRYYNSSSHTRTMLIISTSWSQTTARHPIVEVANFGNHK